MGFDVHIRCERDVKTKEREAYCGASLSSGQIPRRILRRIPRRIMSDDLCYNTTLLFEAVQLQLVPLLTVVAFICTCHC